jgi:hypothetical protein
MKNNHSNVTESTSDTFKGMIGLVKTEGSWVAKWQRISKNVQGVYALTVDGILPDDFIQSVEQSGKTYFQRARSFRL